MTFSAKKTLASLSLEPFEFEDLDGKRHELPHLKSLSTAFVTEFLDGNLLDIIDGIATVQAAAAIRNMPVGVVEKLAIEWRAHSEAEPGESAASPGSSESTARPSAATSNRSTGSRRRTRSRR